MPNSATTAATSSVAGMDRADAGLVCAAQALLPSRPVAEEAEDEGANAPLLDPNLMPSWMLPLKRHLKRRRRRVH